MQTAVVLLLNQSVRSPDYSLGDINQIRELLREVQFRNCFNLLGNQPETRGNPVTLQKDVDAKTSHALEWIAKIQIHPFSEEFLLTVAKNFEDQALTRFRRDALVVLLEHFAVNAHERRRAAGQVKVGCALRAHESEKVVDSGHVVSLVVMRVIKTAGQVRVLALLRIRECRARAVG